MSTEVKRPRAPIMLEVKRPHAPIVLKAGLPTERHNCIGIPPVPALRRIILDYTASPLVNMVRAVESDNRRILPWLVRLYSVGPKQLSAWMSRLIRAACIKGQAHTVRWLLRQNNRLFDYADILLESPAAQGHITIMKMIIGHQGIRPSIGTLAAACKHNQLGMVKWMIDNYDFERLKEWTRGSDECSPFVINTVCEALSNGNLQLAEWFTIIFNCRFEHWCGDRDFRDMLATICGKGLLFVLRWIFEKWLPGGRPGELSTAQWEMLHSDIMPMMMYPACSNGHINVVKFISTKFVLSKSHICKSYASDEIYLGDAFQMAALGGHLDIVKWMVTKFNIILADFSYYYAGSTIQARTPVFEWLRGRFPRSERIVELFD